ncbi:MAG: hypothetical protein WD070_02460 [Pirellulaceae bacterium]
MTSPLRRKHRITAPTRLANAIGTRSLIPSRESLLSAVLATATLLPNVTLADQTQPSLLRNSTAAQARPIREAAEPPDAKWAEVSKRRVGGSSTTLRWQQPQVATQIQPAAPVQTAAPVQRASHVDSEPARPKQVANKVLVWGQDAAPAKGSQVRLVTQLGQIDPFDDPFGDRGVELEPPSGRTFISQPPFSPSGDPESETQALPDAAPEPVRPPSELDFSPFRDDAPEPAPLNGLELPADPFRDADPTPPPQADERPFRDPVMPSERPVRPSPDCDKIYNERDCCAEGEQCRNARHRVYENTIDKISLNISPSFKPDATTEAEAEQARSIRLAQSAIRSWRNREGEVIARGQVTNFQFGNVHVEHEGKTDKVPVKELSDDDWCFLAAWWGVPTECSLGDDRFEQREWLASTMTWKASGVCHKPLYFEEVQLERYGHSAGPVLQPALSGAHFFLNIATLPYQMGMSPPNECEYALGYYRPGNCAPWLLPPIPLSVRGALMEAGVITGGVFIIP